VIHNYRNPYEKWNIFVAGPHLWQKLGMVKTEIMLCEMVLNIRSRLRTLTNCVQVSWQPWDEMDQRIIDKAVRQWYTRLRACIESVMCFC